MAEEIPFDEIYGPQQPDDGWDHQEVSEVNDNNFPLRRDRDHQNIDENNASKKSYLGVRRDRNGKWVRRHCSEKRYPRMAEKVNASSRSPSSKNNDEHSRHENKQSYGVKGRPSSSPRRRRQEQRRLQQQQQQEQQESQQLSSRQSDHSQHQPLHIEQERRTAPEEAHAYIHNKKVAHHNHTTRSAHEVYNPILPLNKPKPSQKIKVPSQFKQESHVVEAPSPRRRQKQKHKLIFDVSSFQSNQNDWKSPSSFAGDEISGLFTTNSKLTSATRQSSLGSDMNINDEERIRRFGDAYNAIMLAHQANEVKPSEPRSSYSGKRWARDPKIASALSIDGRSYIDLQRTPTLSLKQMMTSPDVYDSNKGMLDVELFDRRASWLVHMPRNPAKHSSSGKERVLFEVKEESTTEEECRSPDRKETTKENITPLTPCLKKLNDIETKIQAIETGQKFDLEENRRAIVQAGLPPRNRVTGQRDGVGSASSVIRRFNQFAIDEESTTEEEQQAAAISRSNGKKSTDDIETKMQTIETGQNLDFEENRRAIVQAGLPLRNRVTGQRDGVGSASSVIRRFNQLAIVEELTTEQEQETKTITRSYDKNSTEAKATDDYNSGIDNAPIVGTSTLRLLFSGKSEGKETNGSNEIINNTVRHESKKSVPRIYLKSSFPTASNVHALNYADGGKIDVKSSTTPEFHNGTLPTSVDGAETAQNLESAPDDQHNLLYTTTSTDGNSFNPVEEGKANNDTQILLRHDLSAQRPDPPDSVKQEKYDASSYEKAELAPQLEVANLVRASLVVHARSFIDTDENLDDFDEEEEQTMTRSMLMSPSLITKRYQQVLGAIEAKNWEQVSYLTHANPWLMEMKDVRNDQYLIHSLALFSGGQIDEDISSDQLSIQEEIVLNILEYEPGVVHRLDAEGYLPLHMAAASGNIMMIKVLGERFPAAASVQNHEGLLPLHLAVMSCALYPTGEHAVDLILNLFPAGVVVKENDGNTPLHTAAGALRGDVGVSIITRLLQVHEDILTLNPTFLKDSMGQPKIPQHFDEATVVTLDDADDENCYLSMMKNKRGETPLIRAIKSRAGRQVVDVLLSADGGSLAALDENSSGACALHLILRHEYYDAAVAISILKAAPSTAAIRDINRILPIQLACANSLQREIILAIAIIDLPIDLGSKEDVILRTNFGASWWFLLCESNDEFVDIVTEILALCSHPQKMALCLTVAGGGNEETAVACATPLCKSALREGLRFLGRFEFVGGDSNNLVSSRKVQKFDAIDYGPANNLFSGEKKVSLICYGSNEVYLREAKHLRESKLELKFYEEFEHFDIGELDDANIPSGAKIHHCVAVTKSKLSLSRVVAGMPRNHEYRTDLNLLKRYFSKVKSIMFRVGQGTYKLHACNIIHGQIDSHSIMKFGDRWKITGLCGSAVKGGPFSTARLGAHSPPEAFVRSQEETPSISKNPAFVAEPSADIWAFGMLIYEAFVGESMFASFVKHDDEDLQYRCIAGWSNRQVKILAKNLTESGISALGIDLVCNCLRREPNTRTRSMTNILQHEFWKEKY